MSVVDEPHSIGGRSRHASSTFPHLGNTSRPLSSTVPAIIQSMDLGRHGPLIGAAVYVVAVGVLLSTLEDDLPEPVKTSLAIRQWAFMTRTLPPAGAEGTSVLPIDSGTIDEALADLTRRVPSSDRDRMRGVAVSVAFGRRHLVPLFAGPLPGQDQGAEALVSWALDPTFRPTADAILAVQEYPMEAHLKDHLLLALASAAGDEDFAARVRSSIEKRRSRDLLVGGALGIIAIGLLVGGGVMWFRLRRGLTDTPPLAGPWQREVMTPIVRVLVYFLALFLTANILIPLAIRSVWPDIAPGPVLVWTYLVVGSAGLWLVHAVGRGTSTASWSELVGLRGCFSLSRIGTSLGWAARAYMMLWPATLLAATLWSGVAEEGRGAFEHPMAVLLATEPDVTLLLATVAILAPLFEEPLFRGYVYGRLRRHMSPIPAAAVSGLIFGAAHLSWSSLLPLSAIGFTLALAYERSRDLATPILAHAVWNLVEALLIVAVFRG